MLPHQTILQAIQAEHFFARQAINPSSAPRQTITYQFAGTTRPADLPTDQSFSGWQALSEADQRNFVAALTQIETFLNVEFREVQGQADPDINVAQVDLPSASIGYGGYYVRYAGATITDWDGYTVFDRGLDLSQDRYDHLIFHELGHALGLQHPHEAQSRLPSGYDNNLYTNMAYATNPITGADSQSMMLFDLLALQDIWGAAQYNTGNTVYAGPRQDNVDVIWDTGGRDTLDGSDRDTDLNLNLTEGVFSSFDQPSDLVIAFGCRIEAAIGGSGNDTLNGNSHANRLVGGRGEDALAGLAGDDRLAGSIGADTLHGGDGSDRLNGNRGGDHLVGGDGHDSLQGHRGRDTLVGNEGNDLLVGGQGRDIFLFNGVIGRDTIRDFDSGRDVLDLRGLSGVETAISQAQNRPEGLLIPFGTEGHLLLQNVTLEAIQNDILF